MKGDALKSQIAEYLKAANLPYEKSTLKHAEETRTKAAETLKGQRIEKTLSPADKNKFFSDIRKYRSGPITGLQQTMKITDFAKYFPEGTTELVLSRNVNRIANDLNLPDHPKITPAEESALKKIKEARKKKGDPTWVSKKLKGTPEMPLQHMRAKGISPALNNLTYIDVLKNSVEFQKSGVEPLRNELVESMQKVFSDKKPGWEKELEKLNFKSRHYANKVPKHLKGLIVFEQMDNLGNFTEKGIGGNPYKALGKGTALGDIKFDTLTREDPLRKTILDFADTVKKSGGCRFLTGSQAGGAVSTCREIIKRDPVGSANKLAGMAKFKNTATSFLGMLGKGGVKAAPLAAVAAVGAVAEPLVKYFRNDDPDTYLSNEQQQKGMLLATLEAQPTQVDEEILKWRHPGEIGSAAAAIPGSGAMMKARKARGFGLPRQALGPAMKILAGTFSPLGVAATLPISVAAQAKGGSEVEDIATDPLNWLGPAFASSGARMATRGMAPTGILAKAIRMGMSPAALRIGSRFLGLPGLALTAGMWGYDKWKNWDKEDIEDDEFKVQVVRSKHKR